MQQSGCVIAARRFHKVMSSDSAGGPSTRELRVLQLVANGHTSAQIARELSVSPSTVQGDLDGIYVKLGVADRASAVGHALQAGLIS
jgi:DNA-binding NarL/FixJ family response regulator